MRAILAAVFGAILRLFFRDIEIVGEERIPTGGRVIFVLNHPNALVDPAFMLCFPPRKTTFLAKAPIFRMPVVGSIARAFECLPVYRQVDHDKVNPAQNRKTFDQAHELLGRGVGIAIFPEGASHCDPKLRPLKTGAARIALGASASTDDPLWIVPAGLFYTAKATFRSSALLHYSDPIVVPRIPLDDDGEPPHDAVRDLTATITEALNAVTLQADSAEILRLARRAEELFAEADDDLVERVELQQGITRRYSELKEERPAEVAAIIDRLRRMEALFEELGLPPGRLEPETFNMGRVLTYTLSKLTLFVLLLAPALVGVVTHIAPYHLIDFLAKRYSGDEGDMLSSIKILGALLFFPLTWLIWAGVLAAISWQAGLLALVFVPLSGLAAMFFTERLDRFAVAARAMMVFVRRADAVRRLAEEQEAIRQALLALAEEAVPAVEQP